MMRDRNGPLRRLLRERAWWLPSTMTFFFLGLMFTSHFYTIDVHGFSSTSSSDHPSRIVQRTAGRQHEQQYPTRISAASPSFFSLQSSSLTDGSGGSSSTTAGTTVAGASADNDAETTTSTSYTVLKADAATTDWELDCYSRPVVVAGTGKKLWEVLITDSAGSFRFRKSLPSNQVNSKTLRTVVDELIDVVDVKPSTIRFFRGAMFNMIQIALAELPVTSKPSRCTFALAGWLEELHRTSYPAMDGYNANMVGGSTVPSFLDVRTPIKLPDSLRGEKYAFVALPVQEFLPGGGVTADTIGVGRLCQLPDHLPADEFVPGLVVLSARAPALAAWLSGTEIVAIQADLRKRVLTMETDIDTQYLMAKLNDQQRVEAASFEEGKDRLDGLHFVSVQKTEDDDPEGFWLLRELPSGI